MTGQNAKLHQHLKIASGKDPKQDKPGGSYYKKWEYCKEKTLNNTK